MVTGTAGKTPLQEKNNPLMGRDEPSSFIGALPVSVSIPMPAASPAAIFKALKGETGFLLESMEGVPRRAVRSIIGLESAGIISITDRVTITGAIAPLFPPGDETTEEGDPVIHMKKVAEAFRITGNQDTDFSGGFVGYFSYDMVSRMHHGLVPEHEKHGTFAKFLCSTRCIIFDHIRERCTITITAILDGTEDRETVLTRARREAENLAGQVSSVPTGDIRIPGIPAGMRPDSIPGEEEQFARIVQKGLDHIRAGDIFQVVLSREFSQPFTGDPYRVYEVLRQLNPSPYLYYLAFPDETIIGSSPEMLVRVTGDQVTTVPIAGTRPRGRDPAEDNALAEDLLSDGKECAEHLMLVDLARNDIGRVSAFGSVRLDEFMSIEKFSHVQHITSTVTGTLHEGCDQFDAFASCFPAGTVSGAPKIRAMQIISELENRPRGLYAGAVGYIGFSRMLEFAIAIRTIIISGENASISVGAGIVADSDPCREYEETNVKGAALAAALHIAGELP